MRTKVFSVLAILAFLAAQASAEIKWTAEAIGKELAKAGFHVIEVKGNVVYCRNWSNDLARIEMDSQGRVMRGGVGFYGRNMDSVYRALTAIYIFMQADMGKFHAFDRKQHNALIRRMQRLENTIVHNLKLNDITRFQYDDLWVTAWKNPAQGYIVIEFEPQWR